MSTSGFTSGVTWSFRKYAYMTTEGIMMTTPTNRKTVDKSKMGSQCSVPEAEKKVQKRALTGVTNAMTMTVKSAPSA